MGPGWEAFFFGALGAFLLEFHGWYQLRNEWIAKKTSTPQLPNYARSVMFWVITIASVAIGGLVAAAHQASGADLRPWVAINLGAFWPLIIKREGRRHGVPSPGSVG